MIKDQLLFIGLSVISLFTLGCNGTAKMPGNHKGPAGSDFGKHYQPGILQQDLDFLVRTLEKVHPNLYARVTKTTLDSIILSIRAQLKRPLTRFEFYKLLAPALSTLGDGHTFMDVPYEEFVEAGKRGSRRFPLELGFSNYKALIAANYSGDSSIHIGDQLVSINGISMDTMRDELLNYMSGERISFRLQRLSDNFRRLLWVIYGYENRYELCLRNTDSGEIRNLILEGINRDRLNQIQSSKTTGKQAAPYTFSVLSPENIGFINFRQFADVSRFDTFLKESFERIRKENIASLIIDIRNNGGGNSQLGDMLISYITTTPFVQYSCVEVKFSKQVKKYYWDRFTWRERLLMKLRHQQPYPMADDGEVIKEKCTPVPVPENSLRFDGNVYVLIDQGTFSSAADFAATIKDYKLGTLIGQETGGLPTTYGDCYMFDLPHTRLLVSVSHKRFVRPSGADDGRGVLSDHEVAQTPEDRAKDIDTAIEFTKNLIKSERRK